MGIIIMIIRIRIMVRSKGGGYDDMGGGKQEEMDNVKDND